MSWKSAYCQHARMGREVCALGDLVQRIRELWTEFLGVNANTFASSMAYFSFLSTMPLLVLFFSIASLVGVDKAQVIELYSSLLPETLQAFAESLINDAYAQASVTLSLSTITLLWSASKGIKAMRRGLNSVYAAKESRSPIVIAIISIVSVIVLNVLLVTVMSLVYSGRLFDALGEVFPDAQLPYDVIALIDLVVSIVLGTLGITAFYAFIPAVKRPFVSQLPGALCATVACGIFSYIYYVYIDYSGDTVLYGSIAPVVAYLVWMYLDFYILLAGGFINRMLEESRGGRWRMGVRT